MVWVGVSSTAFAEQTDHATIKDKVSHVAEKTVHAVGHGLERAGVAVKHAGKKTVSAIERVGHKVGHKLGLDKSHKQAADHPKSGD